MIFTTPELGGDEQRVLAMIDELRAQLQNRVAEPRRWVGGLRRVTFARAVQGSNTIEGYHASLDDVVAAVDDEPPLDADDETRFAIEGYRDAMTYVLQVAQDHDASIDEGVLKALHFMMLRHELAKYLGRWRPGAIFVRREPTGDIVYEAPDYELVPDLIAEMIGDINASGSPVLVRAAMAHLNLVMIHPFKDGNGRMARCLQTLVLAKERILAPVFSSIEEYLGRNTQAYYAVLGEVGQGTWHPERSAMPWVRYCLTAHYRQAMTLLRRLTEYERLYVELAELGRDRGLPQERMLAAPMDAALGLRVRNASYRAIVETSFAETITDLTASRDLKTLVDKRLLDPIGERRGRYYVASQEVRKVWEAIKNDRPPRDENDPFTLLRIRDELDAAAAQAVIPGLN